MEREDVLSICGLADISMRSNHHCWQLASLFKSQLSNNNGCRRHDDAVSNHYRCCLLGTLFSRTVLDCCQFSAMFKDDQRKPLCLRPSVQNSHSPPLPVPA
eukprot:3247123-Amphidinium_carterae.1